MMNRAEHLAWAKRRAFEYVEAGQLDNAVTSMLSDLDKFEGQPPLTNAQRQLNAMQMLLNKPDALTIGAWIESIT